MIYIFEGHDRVGKSTTAKILKEKLKNSLYYKGETNYDDNYLLTFFETQTLNTIHKYNSEYNLIIDRFYFSEYVYAKFFNRKVNLDFLLKIHNDYKNRSKIIHLSANKENLIKRFSQEKMVKIEDIEKIGKIYDECYNFFKVKNIIKVDTSDIIPEKVADIIIEKII